MSLRLWQAHPCLSFQIRSHPTESFTWISGTVSPPVSLILSFISYNLLSSLFTPPARMIFFFLKLPLILPFLCSNPCHSVWVSLYHGRVRFTLHLLSDCLIPSVELLALPNPYCLPYVFLDHSGQKFILNPSIPWKLSSKSPSHTET